MAAVLDQFAAGQQRSDELVGEKVVEHLGGDQPGGFELVEPQHDADGDGVPVGVQEPPAASAQCAVPDDGVRDSVSLAAAEALLHPLSPQHDDRLHPDREVAKKALFDLLKSAQDSRSELPPRRSRSQS